MAYIRKIAIDIKKSIENVFKNVFGNSVTTSPSSTVGVFTQELTNIGVSTEDTRALLFSNVYDPNYASDKYLDGLCAFHQIVRNPATFSQVTVNLTGLDGVVIPAGAEIINRDGKVFKNDSILTIVVGGVTGTFTAVNLGPISCVANTVNRIKTPIPGWDTVNNPTNGTTGKIAETDNSLRLKRKSSLFLNSAGSLRSIISALEANRNVIDYNIYENYTNVGIVSPAVISAKSLYLVVYLTDSSDNKKTEIAEILYLKKSAGCAMMGSNTYNYTDPLYPWIIYPTKFDLATERAIEMNINVNSSLLTDGNTPTKIRNAVIASFLGTDGSEPVQMGTPFSVSKFYPAVINQGVYIINSFTMNIIGNVPGQIITTAFTEVATLNATNINVTIVVV